MQKVYKRTGKAIAVLHFFIGLIVVAIFLTAAYFCLQKMDYSYRLNPDTTMRPYVEMTASPDELDSLLPEPEDGDDGIVDLTPTESPTPEPTPEATPTPEPTPIPTATPEPTATPVPTPEPTRIPGDKLSAYKTRGFKIPAASTDATAAITKIYVSAPNNNSYVDINGYCYIDDPSFDGSQASAFLVVTQASSGKQILYQAKMSQGITGVSHDEAQCLNASNTDFDVVLRVAGFADGEYNLGIALLYKVNGKTNVTYYQCEETFTVKGETVVQATEAFANAAAMAEEADEEGDISDDDIDFVNVDPEDFEGSGANFPADEVDTAGASVSVG